MSSMAASLLIFTRYCMSLILIVLVGSRSIYAQLSPDFYSHSCPELFPTVKSTMEAAINREGRLGASILRLFFHDCFVKGCDASNLFDDTPTFIGEKKASPNRGSARGFYVIDNIKDEVENMCPGVVSCADILAIAARDAVTILGGPYWDVKLGRRDAMSASQAAANTSIPPPTSNLTQLISSFTSRGLSITDMVALTGGHTIGRARCRNYRARIYNEPNIDMSFSRTRRCRCPRSNMTGNNNLAPVDYQTPGVFDNSFFKNLVNNKGLLHSDQQLYNHGAGPTDSIVLTYSYEPSTFASDFAAAMIKMGDIGVLTGSDGEIRKNCRRVNY
ncbi:peroxidase 4-like isoform X1 [Carica papaya]|uniref:peroxidase 4-like isoform X1 n=1 Tax=Carica papaya TaxID=3649 RepID=UPI000B8CFC9B|nr:peroxidase 4-like isoform X1 [Carica papaya]